MGRGMPDDTFPASFSRKGSSGCLWLLALPDFLVMLPETGASGESISKMQVFQQGQSVLK